MKIFLTSIYSLENVIFYRSTFFELRLYKIFDNILNPDLFVIINLWNKVMVIVRISVVHKILFNTVETKNIAVKISNYITYS